MNHATTPNPRITLPRSSFLGWLCLSVALVVGARLAAVAAPVLNGATIIAIKGTVEVSRSGATAWDPARTNQVLQTGDQLRTAEHGRATLRLRNATIAPVDELTTLRVADDSNRSAIEILRGVMSFFHRDDPDDVEVRGGGTSAIIRGTEFTVSVDPAGNLQLVLFDGKVELTNALGQIQAGSGDIIVANERSAPQRTPALASTNRAAIQWVLSYPAVLDPADVRLSGEERSRWENTLHLYRSGALLEALESARNLGTPISPAENLLHAALRLASGDVPGFHRFAASIPETAPEARLRDALQQVLLSIQFLPCWQSSTGLDNDVASEWTATEWLAKSYCDQSQGRLEPARDAARQATLKSPDSGFAHARLAALEFGFGHTSRARSHLTLALELSPRLASAVALDGFLLAARHRLPEARARFDQALALDPALADAWLGRGLVRFRSGDRAGALIDLETAAALEPLRAVLRSYLAKAFAEEAQDDRAFAELDRARDLDPNDPTTPLYSALLHYRRYELGPGIRDLESSVDLNDQRAIYRSRLLLDQDAAVRSANLANLYELADMSDVSRRESARAVASDYASHSAHLNLASSYNALRDPTRFNLRNETVWFNEHLLASLLAPTDAAPLSQNLSQNEYSRLFARDRLGLNTTTEYFGSGEWRQLASQVGNSARFSYALDLDYHSKPGFRPNEDFTRIEWYTRAKAQLTPQDSVLLLAKYQDFEGGDLFQYANLAEARPKYRADESQKPILLAGLHHEWSPGSHTLLLAGRLTGRQRVEDLASSQIVAFELPAGDPFSTPMDIRYQTEFEAYSAEASHILQSDHHTTVAGLRFQTGDFESAAVLDSAPSLAPGVFDPIITTSARDDFQRASIYTYHTWEILPNLRLTGGFSYDRVTAPNNFRRPPLSSGDNDTSRWSPKAALVYSPTANFAIRGLYAESLGGVSYDESIRLEPTQLAGFAQSFRTLISESLIGSVESPRHRSAGLGLDLRLPTQTYLSTEATWLDSRVEQQMGYFAFNAIRPIPEARALPETTSRNHDYTERGARFIVNQILAEEWFIQGAYQFTRSTLDSTFPNLPATSAFERTLSSEADLHSIRGSLLYQRPDGWFTRITSIWQHQDHQQPASADDEDFAQLNLFVGYRFPRHLGELTVGVLNLTDRNYGLSPLTPYEELPRERMVYLRLRLQL